MILRQLKRSKMKRSWGIAIIASFFAFLVLRYFAFDNPLSGTLVSSPVAQNASDPLRWKNEAAEIPEKPSNPPPILTREVLSSLFEKHDFSEEENQSLLTWNRFREFMDHARGLPHAAEAVKEAIFVWENLARHALNQKKHEEKEKEEKSSKCPYSIRKMEATAKLNIPCGMIQGSSVTVIGTPIGLIGDFRIELIGDALPGDPDPPVVFHLNVRLMGDKRTDDPVMVMNTWTQAQDWGPEERCPSSDPDEPQVDGLEKCSGVVGQEESVIPTPKKNSSKHEPFFPFKLGRLAITTIRVGGEGIQITVDGKHISSFAYRQSLEPWLISQVRISGDFKAISLLAGGLPTSEDFEHVADLQTLKSTQLTSGQPLTMFVGVVSTANNFKRRMAVRRSWMQYDAVKSGLVAVRFFVGLHKNQIVNEELWIEARSYGDVQLLPFVDYYSLITWKSIAICIFGTDLVSAEYVMKADDDSFVRVDEVLRALTRVNVSRGLLYGLVSDDSEPHRTPDSKWYITPEEWPEEKYPPWAHGPGYVVSRDVAQFVHDRYRSNRLKMFKLEDVAMGIWMAEMGKEGTQVKYVNEERIYVEGCEEGYVVAHYQGPRDMLCLWQTLKDTHRSTCCYKR